MKKIIACALMSVSFIVQGASSLSHVMGAIEKSDFHKVQHLLHKYRLSERDLAKFIYLSQEVEGQRLTKLLLNIFFPISIGPAFNMTSEQFKVFFAGLAMFGGSWIAMDSGILGKYSAKPFIPLFFIGAALSTGTVAKQFVDSIINYVNARAINRHIKGDYFEGQDYTKECHVVV